MKKNNVFQKLVVAGATVAVMGLGSAAVSAQSQPNRIRIGVYDSRAVAVAYANSTESREAMKSVQADYQKAKSAKDEKKIKEIESQMKLRQLRMHEQGFSTGSVARIMAKVKEALPSVAKQAGVSVIVSKWELNFQTPEVEVVDVTDEIVGLFHVSDKGKEWAKGVREHTLVPIEEITQDMD
jgi:hypothetical protein